MLAGINVEMACSIYSVAQPYSNRLVIPTPSADSLTGDKSHYLFIQIYTLRLPAALILLACASKNLQQVRVNLHARLHASSCAIPNLILTSPIFSPSILYGSANPLPLSDVLADSASTNAPSCRIHSKKATMAMSKRRCMNVRPRGISPEEYSSRM